jgi:alkylation response protein AidB-like acyl-CoA dehydrogenase
MADQADLVEHQGMSPDPESLLAHIVALGLPRLHLPRALGGQGADATVLAAALQDLARQAPAAAWMAWSHCMAIEALVHSPNVAVRECVLPSLLDGSMAGAVSWSPDFGLAHSPKPVQALPLDRGWHLSGRLEQVLNLQWMGYLMLCPVWFKQAAQQPDRLGWTLLRSEEDGLRHEPDASRPLSRPLSRAAACGTVHLKQVYFREDELLADDAQALSVPLRVLDQTLRAALWAGALQRPRADTHDHRNETAQPGRAHHE